MNFNLKHFIQCFIQSSKKILNVPRWCFFCGSFLSFVFHVCHAVTSVPCSFVVTCWQISDLFVCDLLLCFVIFPCGVLGQVWYLIESIPDLCLLSYFEYDECIAIDVGQ